MAGRGRMPDMAAQFLRLLSRYPDGVAPRLLPRGVDARARQWCRSRGLAAVASHGPGHVDDRWHLTDAGRERLAAEPPVAADAPESIACVAVMHDGVPVELARPARHHHVIRKIAETLPPDGFVGGEQGFMTSRGRFVGREEGGRIALAAGQTAALKWGKELYSEDLW